jgi:hypothetical protein
MTGPTRDETMPTFEIEQYELHAMKHRVEAKNEADAIAKLFNGEAEPVDDSLEYIEVAEDYGMPADQNQDLAKRLRKLGIAVGDDIIGSVRSIRQVE